MDFGSLQIDFNVEQLIEYIVEMGALPLPTLILQLFKYLWLIFFFVFFFGFKLFWLNYIQEKKAAKQKNVLLAIDVPRDNEQSPKAVENIFSQLSALAGGQNFTEKYLDGDTPAVMSLEIVSIDGYVQFLFYCNEKFRDLVESTLYAQYPDLEITEVDDYTKEAPKIFPNENYEMFGTEFILAKPSAYPIKTYSDFEHSLTQEFKDPLASLLENMSRMQVGEQVWIQFLISPVSESWKEEAKKEIKKFLKQPVENKGLDPIFKVILFPFTLVVNIVEGIFNYFGLMTGMKGSSSKKEEQPFKIMNLTPGDKQVLEGMENKASKIAYASKIRLVYLARKEIYSKVRGVASVIGALKQYNTLNMNAFKPDKNTATKVEYFFKGLRGNSRKNKIIKAYKNRDFSTGSSPFYLNTEELASLYHFPDIHVKAPLLKRTVVKRSEPPVSLPIGEENVVPVADNNIKKESNSSKIEDNPKNISKKEKVPGEIILNNKEIKENKSNEDLEAKALANYFAEEEVLEIPIPLDESTEEQK